MDLDPEVVVLVESLNSIAGIRMFDSCYGHPGKECNHQSEVFVGIQCIEQYSYINFWKAFFAKYDGKVRVLDRGDCWVQFSLVAYLFSAMPIVRFHIHPCHDPATELGDQEKKDGIRLVVQFIEDYLKNLK